MRRFAVRPVAFALAVMMSLVSSLPGIGQAQAPVIDVSEIANSDYHLAPGCRRARCLQLAFPHRGCRAFGLFNRKAAKLLFSRASVSAGCRYSVANSSLCGPGSVNASRFRSLASALSRRNAERAKTTEEKTRRSMQISLSSTL